MNNKQGSFVSKNSNSLNAMIKKTSMTIKHNDYTNVRKLLAISLAAIMVFGSFSLGSLTAENSAYGAKPQDKNGKNIIEWSNGVPSGPHENLIIHGKKWGFEDNCDSLDKDGRSVFTPLYANNQTLQFVSNQKSQIENLTAIDPCTEFTMGTPAQVQIPYEENGYFVFWSLKGKPQNSQNEGEESNFALAGPLINHICNVTEAGSMVKEGDSDFGADLLNFTINIQHEDTGSTLDYFDIGETVYDDVDTSGNVTDGDIRLANAGNWTFADDTIVDGVMPHIDDDVDENLVVFVNGTEMYRDTNLSEGYSLGEPIYKDMDMSGNVTENDVRLYVKDGSEALSCSDEDLINGAGALTDKGAFKLKEGKLERWDNTESSSPSKGKGKSSFHDITGLFQWSGAVCDATILTNATINTNGDEQISIHDFDVDMDGVLDAGDINMTLNIPEATAQTMIDDAEDDAVNPLIGGQDPNLDESNDSFINTDKEFAAFIENEFGDDYNCQATYDEWVFNLAQIVNVGLNVINDGGTNVQVRFYPVDTTEYTPVP